MDESRTGELKESSILGDFFYKVKIVVAVFIKKKPSVQNSVHLFVNVTDPQWKLFGPRFGVKKIPISRPF